MYLRIHRREGYAPHVGHLQVVEAHQREVGWNFHAVLLQGSHQAVGGNIIGGNHGCWQVIHRCHQILALLIGRLHGQVALEHELVLHRQVVIFHGLEVALKALNGGRGLGLSAEEANLRMSQLNEPRRGDVACFVVVQQHHIGVEGVDHPVDHDDGHRHLAQLLADGLRGHRHLDNAGHIGAAGQANVLNFLLLVIFAVIDCQEVTVLPQHTLNAEHQLTVEHVADVANDNRHHIGGFRRLPSSGEAGMVACFSGVLLDLCPKLLAHARQIVDGAGHGRGGNAKGIGQLGDGNLVLFHGALLSEMVRFLPLCKPSRKRSAKTR